MKAGPVQRAHVLTPPGQIVPGPALTPGASIDPARFKQRARSTAVLATSQTESLFLVRSRISAAVVPFDLIAYTVPQMTVLTLTKLDVLISDPILAQSVGIGWQVNIDGARVPNIGNTDPITDDFYFSFGDVGDPLEVEPFNVQNGQTIALQITAAVGEFCILTGMIQGKLTRLVQEA